MRVKSLGLRVACGAALATAVLAPSAALAKDGANLKGGNLLVSGSVYRGADITQGVTMLPPGCTTGCAVANADGTYPFVFNNDIVDPSFGVTSPVVLYQLTPNGSLVSRTKVPTDDLVTSFSSKSELALNDSTSGKAVSFMGYVAPVSALDVSNANTPLAPDPTNPDPEINYRAAAVLTQRQVRLHADQRLQRQQRPRRDPQRREGREPDLHRRQRR